MDPEVEAKIADLKARRDTLKRMRDSGIYQSRHGDTSLTFRSMSEIERAIRSINSELRTLEGKPSRPGYVVQTSKGYGA
jgi:hypothetical protein